ncbi:hypothetical protein DY000_02039521 [Brassica cretica]|uniref:Uncharacterized protein n=1 Tax=Brassica cretica TaxID=69181 RepID=A0ABQ7BGP9_BRACR|nr:hypothetical protein DY000_02039521 [Brassica cretica]
MARLEQGNCPNGQRPRGRNHPYLEDPQLYSDEDSSDSEPPDREEPRPVRAGREGSREHQIQGDGSRTPASRSPLGGIPFPPSEVLRIRSPGPPPPPGKRKASVKENLPYFQIWKSLTYSNRLRPALRRLYKGNLNPKARDQHFKT